MSELAKIYSELLLYWFDKEQREMPWRQTRDPYKIWLSEVMLQQTQVDTVIPYYLRFVEAFPTLEALANGTLESVNTYWQGLGYYRRAAHLKKGAETIMEQYGGVFPNTLETISKVPGIGPYTAGAILSIAFNQPVPAVDGNVMRILSRQFEMDADISDPKSKKLFEKKVMALMPDDPNRFNQGLMELGALICSPTKPKCEECPVKSICQSYQNKTQLNYPVKTRKVKQPIEEWFVFVIQSNKGILMEKRPDQGLLAGLYGLPMIPVNGTEGDLPYWDALSQLANGWNELKTFLVSLNGDKVSVTVKEPVTHVFTHKKWRMIPLQVEIPDLDTVSVSDELAYQWIDINGLKDVPIGTGFLKIIGQII